MQNKRGFILILSSILVTVLIIAGLMSILSQDSTPHANEPAPTKASRPDSQAQTFNYPDPKKQDTLPDSLRAGGNGETVLLRTSVTEGRQIYQCQASATAPSGFAWKLQAPFAILRADDGTNVIHSTDPTWLYTEDGSEVKAKIAQITASDGTIVPASVTHDADSIPWLLLEVTDYRGGQGLFSRVHQIQRLYTKGGKAPQDGCNQDIANNHGVRSVDYTAEYVFWGF